MKTINTIIADGKRNAEIKFIRENNQWEFNTCKFKTEKIPYNRKDWKFLAEVGNYICRQSQANFTKKGGAK